jgi:hypothetical protein
LNHPHLRLVSPGNATQQKIDPEFQDELNRHYWKWCSRRASMRFLASLGIVMVPTVIAQGVTLHLMKNSPAGLAIGVSAAGAFLVLLKKFVAKSRLEKEAESVIGTRIRGGQVTGFRQARAALKAEIKHRKTGGGALHELKRKRALRQRVLNS